MSSQAFFWINVGLGLFLILIFLVGKKGVIAPSRLNLRRGNSRESTASSIVTRPVEPLKNGNSVKDLNTIFVYNGHNFDAHEVLGIPAGCSLEMARAQYQAALKRNGHDQLFLEAAWSAIQSSKKS